MAKLIHQCGSLVYRQCWHASCWLVCGTSNGCSSYCSINKSTSFHRASHGPLLMLTIFVCQVDDRWWHASHVDGWWQQYFSVKEMKEVMGHMLMADDNTICLWSRWQTIGVRNSSITSETAKELERTCCFDLWHSLSGVFSRCYGAHWCTIFRSSQ